MSAGRMLFHRDFLAYTGGHGKVWDYFRHAVQHGWDARVYLTPRSLRDASNPWSEVPERIEDAWRPGDADVLFLGGMDWQALDAATCATPPVINLVQGLRHVEPDSMLRGYLRRPAIRICVSHAVAEAVEATGEAVGSLQVIPAAIRIPDAVMAVVDGAREGVLIDGTKRGDLAAAVDDLLRARGVPVRCLARPVPRDEYLRAIAAAEVMVALPGLHEGFYLPALEAMALGTPVVTLDAGGNREYLQPGNNASVPAPEPAAIADSACRLLASRMLRERLSQAGRERASLHLLARERGAFSTLLDDIGETWKTVIATLH